MDPKLIKRITVKDFEHFVDHRSFIAEEVDSLWGKNLVLLKGDKWKQMRPAVSPSFTSSKMKFLFGLMSECAENCVEFFLEKSDIAIGLDVLDVMNHYANDIIASTAFGVSVDSTRNRDNEFYVMAKEATNFNANWVKLTFFSSLIPPVKLIKVMKYIERH
ncbi:cytochrome P450 9e2-like [Leptinotarsa decemlineata]|uniref:cytochrome P450 9e2-like n=1 Tax=Leptinotarsa decemlineata TaxID=7539 RepID=UPI003D308B98